jgi:proline dehydrogenase
MIRRTLGRIRYALPDMAGRFVPEMTAQRAAALCDRLARRGIGATVGYFEGEGGDPDSIMAAYAALLARTPLPYLSVKAPPLGFCPERLRALAQQAQAVGTSLLLDSHGPDDADRTLEAVERLLPDFPGTGCAIAARWRRSIADAQRMRGTSARIRIVRGEWPDPDRPDRDPEADYRAVVAALAGRAAPVAVATHRPALAAQALALLQQSGTPCELEQLRGLPSRRCLKIAQEMDVPTRVYIPFGPGWVPYAVEAALSRPHLPLWWLRDRLGIAD